MFLGWFGLYKNCPVFAPSISQTLPVSVFSACFWPEWRPNNCWRGNVRASGTFIRLILQRRFHKFRQERETFKWSILLSPEAEILVGKFLVEAQFVKVPFYYLSSFPAVLPQIDPSARDHSVGFKLYVFPPVASLFYLRLFRVEYWHSVGSLVQIPQNLSKMQNSDQFQDIMGKLGYKSEIVSNINIMAIQMLQMWAKAWFKCLCNLHECPYIYSSVITSVLLLL